MLMKILESKIKKLIKNWDKIPDTQKTVLEPGYDSSGVAVKGLKKEEHIIILVLDRQKPSVMADYSFDEERIGITRTGKVVWGFDSGCSCPSPWSDNYPSCYSVTKTWKEFEVNLKDFDEGVQKEVEGNIDEILRKLK